VVGGSRGSSARLIAAPIVERQGEEETLVNPVERKLTNQNERTRTRPEVLVIGTEMSKKQRAQNRKEKGKKILELTAPRTINYLPGGSLVMQGGTR